MRHGFGFGLDNQKSPALLNVVPCKSLLVQYTKALETYLKDGVTYLRDKLGSSGLEDGRTTVGGGVLLGDGARYVNGNFNDKLNLDPSVDDFIIEVNGEFVADVGTILANAVSTQANRVFQLFVTAGGFLSIIMNGEQTIYSTLATDANKIRIVGVGGVVTVEFDEVTQLTPTVGTTRLGYDDWAINARTVSGGSGQFIGAHDIEYVNLNGYTANFEETNTSTTVYFTNGEGDFFEGEIQNATGADRETDYRFPSQADLVGHTVSDGLTYFDSNGDLIPSGVIIPYAGNGLAAAYLDATQTVQAPSQFVGELKADKVYTDIAGTPSAVPTGYLKQVTKKYSVVEADKTLTNQWYDHTDPANPVPLVKAIPSANTIDNDQEYTKADAEETLLYDEALTGECKTKATEYIGGV